MSNKLIVFVTAIFWLVALVTLVVACGETYTPAPAPNLAATHANATISSLASTLIALNPNPTTKSLSSAAD